MLLPCPILLTVADPNPNIPFAQRWLREASTARSFIVALLVGSVLNLINQGDALILGSANWSKIVLTYFVPLAVVSYGAASRAE